MLSSSTEVPMLQRRGSVNRRRASRSHGLRSDNEEECVVVMSPAEEDTGAKGELKSPAERRNSVAASGSGTCSTQNTVSGKTMPHCGSGASPLLGTHEESISTLRLSRDDLSCSTRSEPEKTSVWDAVRISYAYTVADVRRRPRNTALGVVATFVLVFFTGLILLGIWKAPYVLLRLSELSTGEMDVVLYGGNSTPFIDFPTMNERTLRSPVVHGSAPRWLLRAKLRSEDALQRGRAGDGTVKASASITATASNVIVIDSKREKEVGIGRAWPYRPIGYGEAQVYHSAAEYVGVKGNLGERINLALDLSTVVDALGVSSPDGSPAQFNVTRPTSVTSVTSFYLESFFAVNNITEDSINALDMVSGTVTATMVDAIASASGKYSSVFGNAVLLDAKQLLRLLMDETCLFGPQTIQTTPGYYFPVLTDLFNLSTTFFNGFNLQRNAMLMVTMLKDRYDMYYAEAQTRNRLMTEKTNSLMEAAGLEFDGSIEYPIAAAMDTFDSFRVLLVSSFIMVVACVVFLGGLLMFTLLGIHADERQFELAMIRAQGMPRRQIIGVLVAQTLAFAVPGTVLGVLFVFVANAIFEVALKGFTHAPAQPAELPAAVGAVCAVLGLVVPTIATWSPVQSTLGSSLRDALDVYRQAQNESKVMMQKLEEMGLATWQVILGFFLLIAGFLVYYCMPLSFIFENMMLFFVLLELILIIMIVGLCMMLYIVEPYAEAGVLMLLLWGGERKLKTLITKNLRSHRDRNSKAYMMFLLTIGCLTAAGTMFSVLATISGQVTALTAGSPVTVVSASFEHPLNQADIDEFLSGEGGEYVVGWGYSSFSLSSYPQITSNTRIANLIGTSRAIGVTALSRSFMDAVYPEYNMVADYNSNYDYPRSIFGKKDVVKSMYDYPAKNNGNAQQGSSTIIATGLPAITSQVNITAKEGYLIPMMVSSAAKDQIGLTINTDALLSYSYGLSDQSSVSTQFYLQPRALMDRVSGFFAISSLPLLFRSGSILIPDTYFKQLLDPINMDFRNGNTMTLRDGFVTEVRQQTLYLQLRPKLKAAQRSRFVNALQAHTDTLWHTTVDTQSVLDELKTVQNLIMYFFYFTAVVCVVLCAFMLWVTFISNVQLNAWAFGVLRSLGFRNAQLVRGVIYEALCVVLSAFVLGLLAGIVIGLTLSAQFSGYLVLPFKFELPYPLILIMTGLALLSACTAPTLPFLSLRKKAIATVLRGA